MEKTAEALLNWHIAYIQKIPIPNLLPILIILMITSISNCMNLVAVFTILYFTNHPPLSKQVRISAISFYLCFFASKQLFFSYLQINCFIHTFSICVFSPHICYFYTFSQINCLIHTFLSVFFRLISAVSTHFHR